ncbi:ferredoxin [Myxococcota bacterium]|nr:ferredoxin [Myxococcota bacterium]
MAELSNRYGDNARGRFYVDRECIDCETCRLTAPENFKRNDDGGYSFVGVQPRDEEEEKQCVEAMRNCPVEAIGDDGE